MREASESADEKELAGVQAASEEIRGGGERGSNELTVFRDPGRETSGSKPASEETGKGAGGTKMSEVSAGRSGFWQQDTLQVDMADMSWAQSTGFREEAGEFGW
jgi:hypothetical protein